MTRGDQVTPNEAVALVRSSVRCTVVDDVFATIKSGSARVVDLDRIACPVLIASVDHDRILPMSRHSGRFRREIPGAEFRVLPGVGHTPMWDAPASPGAFRGLPGGGLPAPALRPSIRRPSSQGG